MPVNKPTEPITNAELAKIARAIIEAGNAISAAEADTVGDARHAAVASLDENGVTLSIGTLRHGISELTVDPLEALQYATMIARAALYHLVPDGGAEPLDTLPTMTIRACHNGRYGATLSSIFEGVQWIIGVAHDELRSLEIMLTINDARTGMKRCLNVDYDPSDQSTRISEMHGNLIAMIPVEFYGYRIESDGFLVATASSLTEAVQWVISDYQRNEEGQCRD